MSRKLHCVIKPENEQFFKMAANQHNLPYEAEHDTNSSGEPLVRIWIELNHASFAETFVTPAYNKNRIMFSQMFGRGQRECTPEVKIYDV